MKRVLATVSLWLGLFCLLAQAQTGLPLLGVGKGASSPPPTVVSTTTFWPQAVGAFGTLSGSDLIYTSNTSPGDGVAITHSGHTVGKYYFEAAATSISTLGAGGSMATGITGDQHPLNSYLGSDNYSIGYFADGSVYRNGALIASYPSWTTGSIVGIAFDVTNALVWFTVDGSSWNGGAGDPSAGTGGLSAAALPLTIWAAVNVYSNAGGTGPDKWTGNFGQTTYAYAKPTGFLNVGAPTNLNPYFSDSDGTLSGNFLVWTSNNGSGAYAIAGSVSGYATGKFYFEATLTSRTPTTTQVAIGVGNGTTNLGGYLGNGANVGYFNDGSVWNGGAAITSGLATYTTGAVIGVAYDVTNQLIWYTTDGATWNTGGGTPAAGTGGISVVSGASNYAMAEVYSSTSPGDVWTLNFGTSTYSYGIPTGFRNW